MKTPKLRKNGDGRAFAVYPGSGGRRAYFGTFGTPEATRKYQVWLADVMSSLASGEPVKADLRAQRTISDLLADYLTWAEVYYAGSGDRLNLGYTARLFAEHSGDIPGDEFGPNALRRFQTHLAQSGTLCRTTINAHVNRVRRIMKWCQSRELVPRGTAQELATVAGLRRGHTSVREGRTVVAVPGAVWRATMPFMTGDGAVMCLVQYWCGMRPGEVCKMTPGEIDRSGPVWFYRPRRHKNSHRGMGLTKAIPKPAQDLITPRLFGDQDTPCFRTTFGTPYTVTIYNQMVGRACKKAMRHHVPVPHWHTNQLRHAIITEIRDRYGAEAAQHWAGHSTPSTTSIYTKKVEGILTRIAEELGRQVG